MDSATRFIIAFQSSVFMFSFSYNLRPRRTFTSRAFSEGPALVFIRTPPSAKLLLLVFSVFPHFSFSIHIKTFAWLSPLRNTYVWF